MRLLIDGVCDLDRPSARTGCDLQWSPRDVIRDVITIRAAAAGAILGREGFFDLWAPT